MSPLLQAEHLVYTYPGGSRAVQDVSFSVTPGSMTAIIGANGSGKTTLLRMLAGLIRSQSGRILLEGADLGALNARHRARLIAYVPQTTVTAFPFRVLDMVLSGRTPYIAPFHLEGAHDRERALESLASTGAQHLADRAITSLSGGERQMVVLARALAQEPRLLLLDEPSTALDLKHRADLMRTLARLRAQRGLSVVMVTHDLQLTGAAFDQMIALRGGALFIHGRPDDVLEGHVLTEIYGEPNIRTQRFGGQTVVWIEP